MRRPAAKVPSAAEMGVAVPATTMTAAEMRVTVAASMTATMAAAVTTAMTAAALRNGITGRRKCGRHNNDGNPDSEF
jgi:hypothetical protein